MALDPKTPATLPATTGLNVDESASMIVLMQKVMLDPSVDIAKLERFEQMYERAQARQAEQSFNVAMAAAQSEMRAVAPDKHNKQTNSDYASYAALDAMARPVYTKHGLALSFNSEESKLADHVLVLCYVSHRDGFSRTYRADMPADGKGAKGGDVMTKTHATGSAFSDAQLYLLRLIFNLAVGEGDDGNQAGKQHDREIVAPAGFEDWFLDMESSLATAGWAQWSKAWNASKPEFRGHLAKTNTPKIDEWKRKARQNDMPQKAAK